jgi:hypothetical protein
VALSVSGRTTDGFDARNGRPDTFDALFGTRASGAPGPLNVDKDLIDARARRSREVHGPCERGTLDNSTSGRGSGCRGPWTRTARRISSSPIRISPTTSATRAPGLEQHSSNAATPLALSLVPGFP